MKPDYASFISPFPLYLEKVGHIKSPTLREIFAPDITYRKYTLFLSLLLMKPQSYFELGAVMPEWYEALADEQKALVDRFDLIAGDTGLQSLFQQVFHFFLTEAVLWNEEHKVFLTLEEEPGTGRMLPVGSIQKANFGEVCGLILGRCGMSPPDADADLSKVKNRRALEIMKKLQKGRTAEPKNNGQDKDMDLPNLITAVAVKSNSINYTNIWDLTVFQLYEQFRREQRNVYFDIRKTSVAVYGSKETAFRGNEWYRNGN